VNYYKRHLGDYAKDAGHLSMLEHGAYTLLLDRCYTTEEPIAGADVYRVARARSPAERAAVDAVLREFFVTDGDAFMNRRANEEIAHASHKREVNREIGKLGGRPKGSGTKTETLTETVSKRNPSHYSTTSTPPPTAVAPLKVAKPSRPEDVTEQVWNDWNELRRKKKAPVTETVLTEARRESVKAAMPLDRFLAVWCNRGSQGLQADWLRPDERATGETAWQRSQRERVAEMTGGLVSAAPPGAKAPPSLVEVIHDSPLAIGRR
jgi:uncharacterized protein YdaU (DUF1376 family)